MFSISSMEKVFSHVGAGRVSDDAKKALRDVLSEYANEKAEECVILAKHAGRKTVKARDVKP
ncbi:MAG: histone [Candidatus Woesearchaeota archaeon]